jgi:hypothetical protein
MKPIIDFRIKTWEEYNLLQAVRSTTSSLSGTESLGYPNSTLRTCTCSTIPHHERCPTRLESFDL